MNSSVSPSPALNPPTGSSSASSSGPPFVAGAPPPPVATGYPLNAPESQVRGRRLAASSLVLIAAVLLTIALFVPWWGVTISDGGAAASLNFLPGSSYSGSGSYNGQTYSGSATYTSANLSRVGFLYEAVLVVGLCGAIAGFAGTGLGFVSASGITRLRRPVGVGDGLTTLAFVLTLLLPLLLVFVQPWAYGMDTTGAGASCGSSASPCNSFWGSLTSGGVTATWGAGLGWYLAVVAVALFVAALVLFWKSDPKLYTREELLGASSQPAPWPSYAAGWPSSPSRPSAGQAPVYVQQSPIETPPVSGRFCPFCGTSNSREYSFCQKCGRALPPPV